MQRLTLHFMSSMSFQLLLPMTQTCLRLAEDRGVLRRPESRIAVVAHAGIIRHTLSAFAKGLPRAAASDLTQEFNNCEMRSVVLSDASVAPPPDKSRFPGGHQWETATL